MLSISSLQSLRNYDPFGKITDIRGRESVGLFNRHNDAEFESMKEMLDYRTGQMIKMENEIKFLHSAMTRLEEEKTVLEASLRDSTSPNSQSGDSLRVSKLEAENRELKRLLQRALEEKEGLQKQRISTELQQDNMLQNFQPHQTYGEVNRNFMRDDDYKCDSVNGSLYFK